MLREYRVVKYIGKGSFGQVYRAIRHSDGLEYAIKEVDIRSMSQKERVEALNEVRLLASVCSPFIIRYKHAFIEGAHKLHIVTDYARCGDLQHRIKKLKSRRQFFSEDTVWSYFIQIAMGLQALHNENILHRDIKAANIFLASDHQVKIGDLGVAKLLKSRDQFAETSIGTPYYLSPEIYRNNPYNSKSDVWSLGCLLFEMMTLRHPFEANDIKTLANKVCSGRFTKIGNRFSHDLQNMVKLILVVNMDDRPSIDEILDFPAVEQRMHLVPESLLDLYDSNIDFELVPTIKVPRNLMKLQPRLPTQQFTLESRKSIKLPSLQIGFSNPSFDGDNSGSHVARPSFRGSKLSSGASQDGSRTITVPKLNLQKNQPPRQPEINSSPARLQKNKAIKPIGRFGLEKEVKGKKNNPVQQKYSARNYSNNQHVSRYNPINHRPIKYNNPTRYRRRW
ncbi:hypothetical protein PCE1_001836 [Barthelona sp. PCE]